MVLDSPPPSEAGSTYGGPEKENRESRRAEDEIQSQKGQGRGSRRPVQIVLCYGDKNRYAYVVQFRGPLGPLLMDLAVFEACWRAVRVARWRRLSVGLAQVGDGSRSSCWSWVRRQVSVRQGLARVAHGSRGGALCWPAGKVPKRGRKTAGSRPQGRGKRIESVGKAC